MELFIIVFLFFILYLKGIYRPRNYPPGPAWQPFVGNTPIIKKLAIKLGGLHLAFKHLANKYNTNVLGLKLGAEYCIVVSSYELVHQVLTKDEYQGRPDNFFIRLRCMGSRRGITCVDGPFWVEQRRFVEKHLKSIGYGRKQMEDMVIGETKTMLNILSNKQDDPIQFGPFIAPSVLNVLWTLSTGTNTLRNDPRILNLLKILDSRSVAFDMAGGVLNSMPWLRFIVPEKIGYNLIVKLNTALKEFFQESIQEHYKTWSEDRRDDLIYSYISEMNTRKDSKNFTDEQLLAICLDLFFGGAATTSSTIDFIFLYLVMYPDVQEKAAQLLQSALKKDEPIVYSDRMKVPYIEAIILETQRFNNVVPLTAPRRVLKDTVLDGYNIKKDTSVIINFHSVRMDTKYWGDPHVFRPERFINNEGKFVNDERVLNYAIGKRRCLGELLARQCIFIFVSSILRKYKISQIPGSKPLSDKPITGIILSPQPYQVKLELRDSA